MKIRRVFALIVIACILLSGCGQAQAEVGSQPQTSSAETSSTTAPVPSMKIDPPTQGTESPAPIKQEVTPKASFPWDGNQLSNGRFFHVDTENLEFTWVQYEYLQPLDTMQSVYYQDWISAVLETYPDDAYFLVNVSTFPTVFSLYGAPDGSEEYKTMLWSTCAELQRRLEEAGYAIYYEEDSWYWDWGREQPSWVVTIMSVGEMKSLHCGDDLSVEIRAHEPPGYA